MICCNIIIRQSDWKNQVTPTYTKQDGNLLNLYLDNVDDKIFNLFKGIPYCALSLDRNNRYNQLHAYDGKDFAITIGDPKTLMPIVFVDEEGNVDTEEALNYYKIFKNVEVLFEE